jgi:putative GTP pyrophosphokinase
MSFEPCIASYGENKHRLKLFGQTVAAFFDDHPTLKLEQGVIHSVKWRMKDEGHLRDKLRRKKEEGRELTPHNLFQEITDLAGVRVLHLHQAQFPLIHSEILKRVKEGDWVLGEDPKAFSWDPESKAFFEGLGLATEIRPTFYTSIHYLVRPNVDSPLCCEIQVRTLFEEIWGEIDHLLNYPHPSQSIACKEQLRTLAKLVGTGTRLVDAIVRSDEEYLRIVAKPAV